MEECEIGEQTEKITVAENMRSVSDNGNSFEEEAFVACVPSSFRLFRSSDRETIHMQSDVTSHS